MLGDATQKLQKLATTAEKLYRRLNELREQVNELRETVDATAEDVNRIGREVERNQVVLEAVAEQQGLDVEELLAAAAIDEAETGTRSGTEPSEDGDDAGAVDGDSSDGSDAAQAADGETDDVSGTADVSETPGSG